MRIAFVSPPFAGHFNPLFTLAQTALEAGYEVDFITGPRKLGVLEGSGIRPVRVQSIGDDVLEAIANTAKPVRSNPFRLLAQFRENLQVLPAIHAELLDLWKKEPPSLLVVDSVAAVAGLVGERLGIPWISTIATPFSIEARAGTPSYCGGWAPMPGVIGSLRDASGRAVIHGFKRAVETMFRSELQRLGLQRLYREDGSEALYSAQSILGFGIRELEFERDWPPAFQMIGPLIESPEIEEELVLPEGRPCVLVTHGTHLLWAKQKLVDEVIALSRQLSGVEFVISMGEPERAGQRGEQISRGVRVEPFVAYRPNLSKFDAIIHHGGAGVTYAAILAGIASLVVPRDYDQFDYAARIEQHGLGLRIGSLEVKAAALALEQVLDRRRWTALAEFQRIALAYKPRESFIETVKRLV